MKLLTFDQIKTEWEFETCPVHANDFYHLSELISLENYIQNNFIKWYDKKLNFIGYERNYVN